MVRFLASSTLAATLLLGGQAMAQTGSNGLAGTWLTQDGRAKIRTEFCGSNKLCGYVVWLKQPNTDDGKPRTDIKNPDPAKRSRPSLGLELMSGLTPDDETHYSGEIYNAEDGKMYSVTVSLESEKELNVHGCMLKFLCGSQSWERVADLPIPSGNTKLVANTPAKPKPAAHHDVAPTK